MHGLSIELCIHALSCHKRKGAIVSRQIILVRPSGKVGQICSRQRIMSSLIRSLYTLRQEGLIFKWLHDDSAIRFKLGANITDWAWDHQKRDGLCDLPLVNS